MSDRSWYHLDHPVRAMLADVVVALVALALLMENVRPRGRRSGPFPSAATTARGINVFTVGWPLRWADRSKYIETMRAPAVPPQHAAIWPFRTWRNGHLVRVSAILLNAIVFLALVAGATYMTRRWLRLPRRFWQFSLLSTLLLPATLAIFAMMARQLHGIPWWLLNVFVWYALACTILAGAGLAWLSVGIARRVLVWCARAWMRFCERAWLT